MLFRSHVTGHKVDLEAEGSRRLAAAYDYLARYPLTADLLGSVTSLTLDGGSTIYPYCYPGWDGETADFDIASLEGIGQCPALTTFQVIALVGSLDLRPLLALSHLAKVGIAHTDVSTGAFADSNARVVATLRQRGVAVD